MLRGAPGEASLTYHCCMPSLPYRYLGHCIVEFLENSEWRQQLRRDAEAAMNERDEREAKAKDKANKGDAKKATGEGSTKKKSKKAD